MRVAMMVQLIDEEEWLRGFIVTWVRRLAARVDHVDVITLEDRGADLPGNVTVYSMGKEHGHGRLRELLAFFRILREVTPNVDVLFSHMTPRYTWLAAPFAAWFRRPQVMWFVHRQVSTELRLAYWASDGVVTASDESFSLLDSAGKLRVLGHGIDTTVFSPREGTSPSDRVILYVGRLAPIKNQSVLIEAFGRLSKRPGFDDVRLVLAGAETSEQTGYADTLRTLASSLGIADRVDFLGGIPPADIPDLYRASALTVNLAPTGGMDKAVLESWACAVPAVFHNRTFLPLLNGLTASNSITSDPHSRDSESALLSRGGRLSVEDTQAGGAGDVAASDLLCVPDLTPNTIADHLAALLTTDTAALGSNLREVVRRGYDLETLMDRLVSVFQEIAR